MASSVPSSSSPLPTEIYAKILGHCPVHPTLFRVSKCCKTLYHLTIPRLYRAVELGNTKRILQFCKTINGSEDHDSSDHDHGRHVRALVISHRKRLDREKEDSDDDDWSNDEREGISNGDSDYHDTRQTAVEDNLADKLSQTTLEPLSSAILNMPNLNRFTFEAWFLPTSPEVFSALKTRQHLLQLSVKFLDEYNVGSSILNRPFEHQFSGLVRDQATLSKLSIVRMDFHAGDTTRGHPANPADMSHLFFGSLDSLPFIFPALRELELRKTAISYPEFGYDDGYWVKDLGPFLALNTQLKALIIKGMYELDVRCQRDDLPISRNPPVLPNGGKGLPEPPFIWPELESLAGPLEFLITMLETPQPKLRRIRDFHDFSRCGPEPNELWDTFFRSLQQQYGNGSDVKRRNPITDVMLRPAFGGGPAMSKSWFGDLAASFQGVKNLELIHKSPPTVKGYTERLEPLSTISSLEHLLVVYSLADFKDPDALKEAIEQMFPSVHITLGRLMPA